METRLKVYLVYGADVFGRERVECVLCPHYVVHIRGET